MWVSAAQTERKKTVSNVDKRTNNACYGAQNVCLTPSTSRGGETNRDHDFKPPKMYVFSQKEMKGDLKM